MSSQHLTPNTRYIASFSGGKDSTLALYYALQSGQVLGLIMMLSEDEERSRSHGIPLAISELQAQSLNLPLVTRASSWSDYEKHYIDLLLEAHAQGATHLLTGDIDVPEHASWHESVVKKVHLQLEMPLWNQPRQTIVEDFLALGFQAIIVSVNLTMGMTLDDLGRSLSPELIQELIDRGIDPCGESGEFHTLVIDGPIFQFPIKVHPSGMQSDGQYAFLTLTF